MLGKEDCRDRRVIPRTKRHLVSNRNNNSQVESRGVIKDWVPISKYKLWSIVGRRGVGMFFSRIIINVEYDSGTKYISWIKVGYSTNKQKLSWREDGTNKDLTNYNAYKI
ncbi:30S ribosomal protein S17 [Candidatus Hodgkinia cicadicola]|uniref:30S ribosomal protein S17 n=1 Tax=Candidatus Hodgkinia cicadicola TaxID=573658 RepID=A0ABX4MHC1_9HYPH|nr:30S ribosomal protein S17 [Candidatus Hodgkinia cicadicola]